MATLLAKPRTRKCVRPGGPRILHVVPALFGPGGVVGGAERYALELARHMAEETPTALVAFGERDRTESLGRLRLHVIGRPWYVRGQRFNPMALGLFPRLARADVVHCHQRFILCSSLSALGCRLFGPARLRQRPGRRRLGRVGLRADRTLVRRPPAHQRL